MFCTIQAPWNQFYFNLTTLNNWFTLSASGQLSTYRSLVGETNAQYSVSLVTLSLDFITVT